MLAVSVRWVGRPQADSRIGPPGGMTSMMIAMMVAGIGSVLAGLLVILYGIPIREVGFGNTLILIGVLGVCTGMILLALSAVVAELKVIAKRLMDSRVPPETRPRPILPSASE